MPVTPNPDTAALVGLTERFMARVKKSDGCWLWTGGKRGRPGAQYGKYMMDGKLTGAHRISYQLFVGPIPEGMTIDHICRTTLCVRPDHLRVLTLVENIMIGTALPALNARKTHCIHGHPFDDQNTKHHSRSSGKKQRRCCICTHAAQAKRYYADLEKTRARKNEHDRRRRRERKSEAALAAGSEKPCL